MTATLTERRTGVNGFTLKLLAVLTMTIDHTAAVLYLGDLTLPMRAIGRIAFPIYCFLLVEGYFHTHSVGKYAGRLAIAAVLSEIPFDLAIAGHFPEYYYQSVMLTLLIGLLTVYLVDHSRFYAEKITENPIIQRILYILLGIFFACAGMALAERLFTDYGGGGVALILVFYLLRGKPVPLFLAVLAVLLEMNLVSALPIYLTDVNFLLHPSMWLSLLIDSIYLFKGIGILAMIPILAYSGQRGPRPGGKAGQWCFYLYYPLHLLVLVAVAAAMNHFSPVL